jgi:glyoxylase-like metal-dependent hydrolase (beta-lactamase superfamily II)
LIQKTTAWGIILAAGCAAAALLAAAVLLGPMGGRAGRLEVAPGVVGIRAGSAYAYLVRHGPRAVLIDAGSDPTGGAILRELGRQGLGTDAVEAVLLTHAHTDHVAAAGLFGRATVYVGAFDFDVVHGEGRAAGLVGRLAAKLGSPVAVPRHLQAVVAGDELQVGGLEVEVVGVPGHTPGSVMYHLGEVLFTGDSLLVEGAGLTLASRPFSERPEQNRVALGRLADVSFDVIADGHNGLARNGRARFEAWARREGLSVRPVLTSIAAP